MKTSNVLTKVLIVLTLLLSIIGLGIKGQQAKAAPQCTRAWTQQWADESTALVLSAAPTAL